MKKKNRPEQEFEDDGMPSTIDFEYLLTNMMGGKRCHGSAGHHDLNAWKEVVGKIFKSLKKHISYNVESTDNFHKKEMLQECKRALENISEAEIVHHVNEAAIIRLTYLAFLLLGQQPDNKDKNILNRAEHYKLDKFRKITCSQTNDQKIQLFLFLITEKPYINKYKESKYFIGFNKKYCEGLCCDDNESNFEQISRSRNIISNSKSELRRRYVDIFHGDSYKFLEWLKKEFKDVYKDIAEDMVCL
ncbi:MAG: hypothetical protein WCX65_07850 [bacterium]